METPLGDGGLIDFFFLFFAHSYKFFIRISIVFRCGSTQESQSTLYELHTGIHTEDIRVDLTDFYFLFTIVMKVLISCKENPHRKKCTMRCCSHVTDLLLLEKTANCR
jgi:hypothetical protein